MRFRPEDVRAFLQRDYAALAPLRVDAEVAHELAAALYRQLADTVPATVLARERADDLATHLRVKALLDRAGDVGWTRPR